MTDLGAAINTKLHNGKNIGFIQAAIGIGIDLFLAASYSAIIAVCSAI
jgi:hypothetical protein